MAQMIRPEDVPLWVPGELTGDSAPLGWKDMRQRGFRYDPSDVSVPALSDYVIVVYDKGTTPIHRRCSGGWQTEFVGPGSVSLLTRAAQSHWRWSERIEVSHLYFSPAAVAAVATEVFDREIEDVEFLDVLNVRDPVLCNLSAGLAEERREVGLGGHLYVDALRTQACIRILRNYANITLRPSAAQGGLSRVQRRRVEDYIEDHIMQSMTLPDLAAIAQLGVCHFAKRFRAEFGCPPYAYVMRRRIERAKTELSHTRLPLAEIAENAGFCDQSHMNRMFRRVLDTTPAAYRRATTLP